MSIGQFALLQLSFIILGFTIWIFRNLWIQNNKKDKIIFEQDKYLQIMYDTIKMTESRIKEIDINQTFQSDDEIGFFFTSIKLLQEQLSEYIKFIK